MQTSKIDHLQEEHVILMLVSLFLKLKLLVYVYTQLTLEQQGIWSTNITQSPHPLTPANWKCLYNFGVPPTDLATKSLLLTVKPHQ